MYFLCLFFRLRFLFRRQCDSSEPSLQCWIPSQTLRRSTHWLPDEQAYFPAVEDLKRSYIDFNSFFHTCYKGNYVLVQYLHSLPLWHVHSLYSSDPSGQSEDPSQYLKNQLSIIIITFEQNWISILIFVNLIKIRNG